MQKKTMLCSSSIILILQNPPTEKWRRFLKYATAAAENGFVSETYENLCCLESLSGHFSPKCVRTLDRGFDANDYYRYFLKHKVSI